MHLELHVGILVVVSQAKDDFTHPRSDFKNYLPRMSKSFEEDLIELKYQACVLNAAVAEVEVTEGEAERKSQVGSRLKGEWPACRGTRLYFSV